MLAALRIWPWHGIFVDVGTSHDMIDGKIALHDNFTVLAVEARKQCVQAVSKKFAEPMAAGRLTLERAIVTADAADGVADMEIQGDSSFIKGVAELSPGLAARRKSGARGSLEAVRTTTLDRLIGARPVAVLKLDIQGAELEALMGAMSVLRRPPPEAPLVVFELDEDLRPDLKRLEPLHLMRGLGYRCYDVSNGRGRGMRMPRGAPLVPGRQCLADYPATLRRHGHPLKATLAARGWMPNGTLFGHIKLDSWPRQGAGCLLLATDFACVRRAD